MSPIGRGPVGTARPLVVLGTACLLVAWSLAMDGVDDINGFVRPFADTFADRRNSVDDRFNAAISAAMALYEHGDTRLSEEYYRKGLSLKPDDRNALYNLGVLYLNTQDYRKAYECMGKLTSLFSDKYEYHYYAGLAAMMDRQDQKAAEHMNQANRLVEKNRVAVASLPQDFYEKLGVCAERTGDVQAAERAFKHAISIPGMDSSSLRNSLGLALVKQGRQLEAVQHYEAAMRIGGAHPGILGNMAVAYNSADKHKEAIDAADRALTLNPAVPGMYYIKGSSLTYLSKFNEAAAAYREGLKHCRADEDIYTQILGQLVFVLQNVCDWRSRKENLEDLRRKVMGALASTGNSPVSPFRAQMSEVFSAKDVFAISQGYAKASIITANSHMSGRPAFIPHKLPRRDERVRLGFVSSNFGNHVLVHLITSVFGMMDRATFEVRLYALNENDYSRQRGRLSEEAEVFMDLSLLGSFATAQQINNDGVHALFDLTGWVQGSRMEVFAMRIAPVQITYLTFIGSIGATYLDYIISDPIATPPELIDIYSEKVVFMPQCYQVNDYRQVHQQAISDSPAPRKDYPEFPRGSFVYCDFNVLFKVTPEVFDIWMDVLKRVPHGVLWLLEFPDTAIPHLRREALERGVEPSRLYFSPKVPTPHHIARAAQCHLQLDTLTFNGGATATDAYWPGVPAITMPGESMGARIGSSLSFHVGLQEAIVTSLEGYANLAVELGSAPRKYAALRRKLAENKKTHPLFDTSRFTKNFERAILGMLNIHAAVGRGYFFDVGSLTPAV